MTSVPGNVSNRHRYKNEGTKIPRVQRNWFSIGTSLKHVNIISSLKGGSGPVINPQYVVFGRGAICVEISLVGVKEARQG